MTPAEWFALAVFVAAALAIAAVIGWLVLSSGVGMAERETPDPDW